MRTQKLLAGMVIAGGLAAAAVTVGAGFAAASPGPATGPLPTWGDPGWGHHDHGWGGGPGWGGGGPGWGRGGPGWGGEGPWGPAGWAGGWQPPGGVCVGDFCV